MVEQLLWIAACAAIGALCVLIIILTLARFGYFEPIKLVVFGVKWRFAPPDRMLAVPPAASACAPLLPEGAAERLAGRVDNADHMVLRHSAPDKNDDMIDEYVDADDHNLIVAALRALEQQSQDSTNAQ